MKLILDLLLFSKKPTTTTDTMDIMDTFIMDIIMDTIMDQFGDSQDMLMDQLHLLPLLLLLLPNLLLGEMD